LAIIAGDHRGLVDVSEIVITRNFFLAEEPRGGRRHRGGDRDGDRGGDRNIDRKFPLAQEP
jgi:hypothetical protein